MILCETMATATKHLRQEGTPRQVRGHKFPGPITLCGLRAAFDLEEGAESANCNECLFALSEETL